MKRLFKALTTPVLLLKDLSDGSGNRCYYHYYYYKYRNSQWCYCDTIVILLLKKSMQLCIFFLGYRLSAFLIALWWFRTEMT